MDDAKDIAGLVQTKIFSIRGIKVMLDSDIAELYGVETRRINEAVKNNHDKFPDDFLFELTSEEFNNLKSKLSTSSWGGRRNIPKAFTEQGVYMLATILKSPVATKVTVAIMRAFVVLRQFSLTYGDIAEKIIHIDHRLSEHDELIDKIISAINDLIKVTKDNETKRIGF